jgi:L-threonylcarbamoyladenylate synthase
MIQPRRLLVDPHAPDPAAIRLAADAVRDGRVVAYPTDTLYGLAVDPRRADAVARVFALKARAPDRALSLIAADVAQVEATLGPLGETERRLADACWPGPLTLVIRGPVTLAQEVTGADGTIAVRVPAHGVARALARAVAHPVTATSANRSGRDAHATPDEVAAALGDSIALLLDAGPTPGGPPSTIVGVNEGGARLLRAGAIPFARVLELLQ